MPYRAPTAAPGPGQLAAFTSGQCADHVRHRLHGPAQQRYGSARDTGGDAMSNLQEMPTPDTPQLLLEHHVKALRLPAKLGNRHCDGAGGNAFHT